MNQFFQLLFYWAVAGVGMIYAWQRIFGQDPEAGPYRDVTEMNLMRYIGIGLLSAVYFVLMVVLQIFLTVNEFGKIVATQIFLVLVTIGVSHVGLGITAYRSLVCAKRWQLNRGMAVVSAAFGLVLQITGLTCATNLEFAPRLVQLLALMAGALFLCAGVSGYRRAESWTPVLGIIGLVTCALVAMDAQLALYGFPEVGGGA